MITHPALTPWLPTAREVTPVQLLRVAKPGGQVWRFADSTSALLDGATTWLGSASAGGLVWRRNRLQFKSGLELGECTVTVHQRIGDLLGALPVSAAIQGGLWDDATFLLLTAFLDTAQNLRGILPRYQGQRGAAKVVNGVVSLQLKPPSITLNRSVPPVYQSSCINTLFDHACGVSRAAFTVAGSVLAGSTAYVVQTGHSQATGHFASGVLTFTGGALVGLSRTVRSFAAGAVTLFDPLPQVPAVGSTITLSAGCNRSRGADGCAKFGPGAELRYRGHPYIPLPETAI